MATQLIPAPAGNTVSALNSRAAATLAAGATFQGVGEEVLGYGRVGVAITSTNATDGVLTMEVSHDGVTWGGPSRTWADTRFAQPHMWNIVEKWFRILYTNGSTEATALSIQVQYSNNADVVLGHQLDEALSNETESQVVRAVGVGQGPTGVYSNDLSDGLGFSTTALLANGATYDSTVLSLVGYTQVQTDVLSDVDGTIVIDFLADSAGTDIVRTLTIPYVSADGFQLFGAPAFTPYVRYRFTADAAGQADFYFDTKFTTKAIAGQLLRLDAFLSPSMVATVGRSVTVGEDPDGTYRNVKTTRGGAIDVSLVDSDLGFSQIVTPGGSAKVAEQTHLVGGAFGGAALNTIKYTINLTGTGTQDATGAGELVLATGATANSAAAIQTSDIARFIPANYNTTHHAVEIPDAASYAANNSRKWGAFNAASGTRNGCYWELDSGTWYVVHCIGGVATRVTRASWNGAAALQFPDAAVNTNVYEIEYNAGSIIFRTNGGVMHRVNLTAEPWTNSVNLPMGIENINSGGSTTDVEMHLRAGSIYTLGKGQGLPRPYYISGTTTGVIVKTGAGHLGKVVISRNGAGGGDATLSLYDGLSAVNQVGRIALDQDTTVSIDYGMSFNTGLYIVITGAGTLGTTVTFD
jgi:hypothetical protein